MNDDLEPTDKEFAALMRRMYGRPRKRPVNFWVQALRDGTIVFAAAQRRPYHKKGRPKQFIDEDGCFGWSLFDEPVLSADPESLRVGEKTGTYSQCVVAAEAASKIKRAYNELNPTLSKEQKTKRDAKLIRRIFEDAVTHSMDTRALRAKYEKKAQKIRNRRLAQERSAALPPADWYNRCHQADCVQVLQGLPDGSIDFVVMDPPYWPYHDGQAKGGLRQGSYRGTVDTACAMPTMTEAKRNVLALIPLLPRKLTAEGTVLYWNTGFHADDDEVVRAFREAGLPNYRAGVWWKKSEAPTVQNDPHTTTFERWLIQRRSVKAMVSYDFDVGRNNFLTDEPVVKADVPLVLEDTMLPKTTSFYHQMAKPESLTEKFLRAYCPPNSLIFDAYGCSGSSSCAALQLGHRFVYCELHPKNFKLGAGRIAAESALRSKASAIKAASRKEDSGAIVDT